VVIAQPITFAYRNLVFGRDASDAWALYRVETSSYDGLAVAAKKDLLGQVAAFAYQAEADFQLLRVSKAWSIADYLQDAGGLLDPRHGHPAQWADYLQGHEHALAGRETARPEVFLAVRLAPPDPPTAQPGPGVVGRDGHVAETRDGPRRLASLETGDPPRCGEVAHQRPHRGVQRAPVDFCRGQGVGDPDRQQQQPHGRREPAEQRPDHREAGGEQDGDQRDRGVGNPSEGDAPGDREPPLLQPVDPPLQVKADPVGANL